MSFPNTPEGREAFKAYVEDTILNRILDDDLRAFGTWAASIPGVKINYTEIDSIDLSVDSLHDALYVAGRAFEYDVYTVTIAADTTSAAYSIYVSLYKDPTKGA